MPDASENNITIWRRNLLHKKKAGQGNHTSLLTLISFVLYEEHVWYQKECGFWSVNENEGGRVAHEGEVIAQPNIKFSKTGNFLTSLN